MEPTIYGEALEYYQNLFKANEAYAKEALANDPEVFKRQAMKQSPKVLWIGCSDSRVASDTITKTQPGQLFVHRNIANMVVATDMNMLAAVNYAVDYLHVEHIIVCGHYGCGGVNAAMGNKVHGLIDNWLSNIRDVYRLHRDELHGIHGDARFRRLVELNVIEQVYNLCKLSTIQEAWLNRKLPYVHGWVYDLETGLIRDLGVDIHDDHEVMKHYAFDLELESADA